MPPPEERITAIEYNPRTSKWINLAVAAVLLIIGGLIGASIIRLFRAPQRVAAPRIHFEIKLPDNAELENAFGSTFALTPDGLTMVYVGRGQNGTVLFRRPMSELTPAPIAGTDSGFVPFVSPDGKSLGFMTGTAIKKVPIEGGAATTIATVGRTMGASWSRGDVIVTGSSPEYHGLQIVPASGGALRPLTKVDTAGGEIEHRWPVVLPDGKTILFTSWRGDNSTARIGIASLETGESHALDLAGTSSFGAANGKIVVARADGTIVSVPIDLANGQVTGEPVKLASGVQIGGRGSAKAAATMGGSLVYAVGSGRSNLEITDLEGRAATIIASGDASTAWGTPRFSPDGRKVAVTISIGGANNVWVYDLATKTRFRLTPSDTTNEDLPSWSPDGSRILFRSSTQKFPVRSALMSHLANGSGVTELVQPLSARQGRTITGSLTPDGRGLVYWVQGTTLWYRQLLGDTTSKVIIDENSLDPSVVISPDGKWIAYASAETGVNEVYVTSFPTPGARWPISAGGGLAPKWSPDGRELYYANGRQIMKATLDVSSSITVKKREMAFQSSVPLGRTSREYDLSPDGRYFLFAAPVDSSTSVIAILNWRNDQ